MKFKPEQLFALNVKDIIAGCLSMIIPIQQHEIDNFFDRYEARINDALEGNHPEIEETARSFSEFFIESSPSRVVVGNNDENFQKAIVQGWDYYRSIGIFSMEILSTQITILDTLHGIVKVHWRSSFRRKDNTEGDVDFDVFYLLHKKDDDIQIFAYITGDEQQAMKNEGLI